jgi:tetratricopeptide (TPR) repeat protein
MLIPRTLFIALSFALSLLASNVLAQDINLLPKFGGQAKNDAQKMADEKFLASIDGYYKGDRKKAAEEAAARGWQFLRQGNAPDAMRRFNQAWLLDSSNGSALWGMAAFEAGSGKLNESLALFAEADRIVGGDIDFAADYAKALGIAGAQGKNQAMLNDAFTRFAHVHQKAPQHTLNLQNWAITLFYVGNFAEAWKKFKLAEATPRHAELDPRFLAALQSKMPRP